MENVNEKDFNSLFQGICEENVALRINISMTTMENEELKRRIYENKKKIDAEDDEKRAALTRENQLLKAANNDANALQQKTREVGELREEIDELKKEVRDLSFQLSSAEDKLGEKAVQESEAQDLAECVALNGMKKKQKFVKAATMNKVEFHYGGQIKSTDV